MRGLAGKGFPLIIPKISNAEWVVLRSSCESKFEVSIKCNSNVNFPSIGKAMWLSNRNG
jgi:hypothetical protein